MATRFYFSTATPDITPAFNTNWEQTGQIVRGTLQPKLLVTTTSPMTTSTNITVPITTTQQIGAYQFISPPIPVQRIHASTLNFVMFVAEDATQTNAFFAYSLRVVSKDGNTFRGTLLSDFNTSTEFNATGGATYTRANIATTAITTQWGDRLVFEISVDAHAPTAAGTATFRIGHIDQADFALTAGLTTDLNPWVEVQNDIYTPMPNNHRFIKVGDGMSVSEKIR